MAADHIQLIPAGSGSAGLLVQRTQDDSSERGCDPTEHIGKDDHPFHIDVGNPGRSGISTHRITFPPQDHVVQNEKCDQKREQKAENWDRDICNFSASQKNVSLGFHDADRLTLLIICAMPVMMLPVARVVINSGT